MNPKEIASQQILFMGHMEDICEKQGLVPPVEVNVVDADGNQCDFEYRPEDDGGDLPPLPIMLPVVLTFTDAKRTRFECALAQGHHVSKLAWGRTASGKYGSSIILGGASSILRERPAH